MVRDSDNRELDKEEAERKRLHDEMMASIRAANEKSLKWREEATQRAEQEKINAAVINKIDKKAVFYMILLMVAFAFIIFFSLVSFGVIKTILGFFVFAVVGGLFIGIFGTSEQKSEISFGSLNPHMNCPHCNTSGNIRTKPITQKKGISGGKAVAGLLTGGVSLLAIGLSRKEDLTQAHCQKCNNTWQF